MRLSIIIPVYNVERYLPDCLASLDTAMGAGAKPEPFELIFINDASTDGSLAMLETWCKERSFARVVTHAENRGLAKARTTGIGQARGEYVAWVDSDDTVAPEWFREIVAALGTKADVIAFEQNFVGHRLGLGEYSYGRDVLHLTTAQFIKLAGYADAVLTSQSVGGYCWNKVIRRELLADAYDAPRGALEDLGAMFNVLPKVKAVYYIPKALVNYYYRPNGLLATFDDARRILHYEYILPKLRKLPVWLLPSAEYAMSGLQIHINRIRPDLADYAILRHTLLRSMRDSKVGMHRKITRMLDSFSWTGRLHAMYIRYRRGQSIFA